MKNVSRSIVLSAVLVAISGASHAATLSISTGSKDGGYDGTICQESIKGPANEMGVTVSCNPSAGSIANMKAVNAGDMDSGITQTDLLYKAWENGDEWAMNLNPGGRSFTTESLLCFSAGGAASSMKQLTEPRLDGKSWRVLTPKIGSGSNGTVEYVLNSVPGYVDNTEIIPMEEWDINIVISRLTSRNPNKSAHVACFVGLPDPKGNNNISVVSANENLAFINMDDNRALQLQFNGEPVYPAISAVPVKGGIVAWATGNVETVDALQVPVTYVYNDAIDGEALNALATLIDQNPNFLLDSGVMGKIMSKLNEGKELAMGIAKRVTE